MALFSIIIPVKPGGHIAALESLRHITAAPDSYEILVAEGCAPSRQRNEAVKQAQGDFIYFIDDDSRVAPDCLDSIENVLSDPTVAAVGGPSLTPADDSRLQQLFGAALSSLLGAGAVRNRYRAIGTNRSTTDKELILCNLAIRRGIFLAAGGFDERLYPNEENELLERIRAQGGNLVHAPGMSIQRSQRRTLSQFIRQMVSYGRGRAQQTLISGRVSLFSFAPLLLLVYLTLLPFLPFSPLSRAPLLIYAALVIWFSCLSIIRSGDLSRILLVMLYPLMHLSNGWGLLRGLLSGSQGRSRPCQEVPVTVRLIKGFNQSTW